VSFAGARASYRVAFLTSVFGVDPGAAGLKQTSYHEELSLESGTRVRVTVEVKAPIVSNESRWICE